MSDPPPMRGVGSRKVDEHGILLGDQRCTPPEIWQVALEAIGVTEFDLDPATNDHSTVPVHMQCFGPKVGGEDGLVLPWWGNVWLNFPFSDPPPWIAKVQREADRMLHWSEVESLAADLRVARCADGGRLGRLGASRGRQEGKGR